MRSGALILAGGRSRRMGRAKPWLELHGRPLLEHVIGQVSGVCDPIVIAAAPDIELPPLGSSVLRIDDPPHLQGRGPLVGLLGGLAGLHARGVERAYLGACDAASLSEGHVEFMLERLAAGSADAVVACDREARLHPLASALRVASLLDAVRRALSADRLRLVELFEHLDRLERVPAEQLPDAVVLEPCNTPEQWAALRARLEADPPRSPGPTKAGCRAWDHDG